MMKNKGIIIGIVVVLLIVLVIFIYPNINLFSNSNNTQNKGESSSKISKNNKDNKDSTSDGVIKVGLHETVSVNDLKIELLSANDSRCPEGVNCYWEGELEYSLDVNGKTIKLGTVQKKEEIYENYKIILSENNNSVQYVLIEIKEN